MLLRHIRYFLAVAEHRNFTRAAEALHVSQPTLSQQIRQLEDSLKTQLLDRSGRVLQLTDAGQVWVQYAKLALSNIDAGNRAIHDVEQLGRGTLRLASTPTFAPSLISAVVSEFNRLYPGVTISVQEVSQRQIESMLSEDELDLGIAFAPTQRGEIEGEALFEEALTLIVGMSHRHANRRRPLGLADCQKEQLVLLNKSFATRQHIDTYCVQQGIKLQVAVEVNAISTIVSIVRRGQLATILPEPISIEYAELRSLPCVPALPTRTAFLLTRKDAYCSAACRELKRLLIERVSATRVNAH